MITCHIAKALMKTWPAYPSSPGAAVGELQEVFRHESFLTAPPQQRAAMMLESSRSKYRSEIDYSWDHYFGVDLRLLLAGKEGLDLGCFNGGRSVAWCERYGLKHITGVDIDPVYIEAAKQFAASRAVPASFELASGEQLPFGDQSFDVVLSFDVFEHVRSVAQTLVECYRVLRPGGRCYVVFPSYYQPVEHHLSLVTRVPAIQCLFSGRTLIKAYSAILNERGGEAAWYARRSAELEPWERSNTLNGMTLRQFKKIVGAANWRVILHSRKPIGSIGRNLGNSKLAHVVSSAFRPLTYIVGLQ
jgi:ubiquinone/menaquinone biosynthesis C-methylase UbiE